MASLYYNDNGVIKRAQMFYNNNGNILKDDSIYKVFVKNGAILPDTPKKGALLLNLCNGSLGSCIIEGSTHDANPDRVIEHWSGNNKQNRIGNEAPNKTNITNNDWNVDTANKCLLYGGKYFGLNFRTMHPMRGDVNNGFTISATIDTYDLNNVTGRFYFLVDNNLKIRLDKFGTNQVVFRIPTANIESTTKPVHLPGEKHNYTIVINNVNRDVKFFVDGGLIETHPFNHTFDMTYKVFINGRTGNEGTPFGNKYYRLTIWNDALSNTEARDIAVLDGLINP